MIRNARSYEMKPSLIRSSVSASWSLPPRWREGVAMAKLESNYASGAPIVSGSLIVGKSPLQRIERDGFDEERLEPDLVAQPAVIFVAVTGERDEARLRRAGLEPARQLEAVHARQSDIHD